MKILTEKFSRKLLLIGFILLLLGIIIFIWKDSNFSMNEKIQSEKIAQFGDFVGGIVGSIWALAGVVLFYVALSEQRNDFKTNRKVLKSQTKALKQQIKEFELQREELSETRKVFKTQSKTLKSQQFESTFFNLVNLHHEIVSSIDLVSYENKPANSIKEFSEQIGKSGDRIITTGRDTFVKFRKGLKNQYKNAKNDHEGKEEFEIVNIAYNEYYQRHQSDLGHYFRNLYHIFKFIKTSKIGNKLRYTSLVRAQLSNDELVMLFYNSISENGLEKFKPLIEEYHLLKNLNPKTLINKDLHLKYYKESAFKKNVS